MSDETQQVCMSQCDLEKLCEASAEKGAKKALESVGLHDPKAAHDINELRDLLKAWRETKRQAWATVVRYVMIFVLGALSLGLYLSIRGH